MTPFLQVTLRLMIPRKIILTSLDFTVDLKCTLSNMMNPSIKLITEVEEELGMSASKSGVVG